MNVFLENLHATSKLGNNGAVFVVRDNDGTHKGRLRLGKGTVEWCRGKIRCGKGRKRKWHEIISYFESE